jgi:hypothetical protein
MMEDKLAVDGIISEVLGVPDCSVECKGRIGKKVEGKARLLKVEMSSVAAKRQVLTNAKKLRESVEHKRVFITPDLSQKEREENKRLQSVEEILMNVQIVLDYRPTSSVQI